MLSAPGTSCWLFIRRVFLDGMSVEVTETISRLEVTNEIARCSSPLRSSVNNRCFIRLASFGAMVETIDCWNSANGGRQTESLRACATYTRRQIGSFGTVEQNFAQVFTQHYRRPQTG